MRPTLSRTTSALLVLVPALALLASGCTEQPGNTVADFRASVAAAPTRRGRIERVITTTGTVRAIASAKAVSEAAGKLTVAKNPRTGHRWAIGDTIRQGELLAVIAPDDLATESRLMARRQALAVARADHARYKALHEQGLLSELQMAEQETRLSNAEADVRSAELQQGKSRLTAPISGVVTTITASPDGEFLAVRESLAEIMDFSELIVDLDLGASDILQVEPAQPVRVGVPGTDLLVEGSVARVAPAIDPKTRTFRVEVALPNQDRTVRPGMFVRSEIVLEARADALLVPAAAVVIREGQPVVFVIEAQRAMRRPVTLGLTTEDDAEITAGLQDAQQVVVSGQETLDDGVKVVVRE